MRLPHHIDLGPTPDLDRAWAATRPEPPGPAALDALWAAAARELDRAAAPMILPSPRARHRRPVGFVLAQAAALLLAAGLLVARRPAPPVEPPPAAIASTPRPPAPVAAAPTARVVVGFDETAIVRLDDDGHRVDRLAEAPGFPSLADATQHEVFNALESMATP